MEQLEETMQEEEVERRTAINSVLSFVLVLIILMVGAGLMIVLFLNKVKANQEQPVETTPTVEVQTIEFGEHEVIVSTQGVVMSSREVSIAAEVGGRIKSIHPQLIEGGTVKEGDGLVVVEEADYEAAVARVTAALADARLMLQQEEARARQAKLDWEKLGRGEASPLVLREPNIVSAKAKLASAEAELARAERDLKRTVIKAPFSGRIRRAEVEVGAVVAPGTRVAELYSDTELEVRLPVPLRDFGYLQDGARPEFEVSATIGSGVRKWPAVLDRIEGEVERATLSGYGIAKILPADRADRFPPVGLFVDAEIPGETLEDVVVVPRSVIRGLDEVWVAHEGKLQKRTVEILRAERDFLVTRGDFEPLDQLVRTRLEAPVPDMSVETMFAGDRSSGGEQTPETSE